MDNRIVRLTDKHYVVTTAMGFHVKSLSSIIAQNKTLWLTWNSILPNGLPPAVTSKKHLDMTVLEEFEKTLVTVLKKILSFVHTTA